MVCRWATVLVCAALVLCRMGMDVSAQSMNCNSQILLLAPCLSFVSGDGPTPQPGDGCCTALMAVDNSSPVCLCELLGYGNGTSDLANLNTTTARELPSACNVSADESQCPGSGPTGSPTNSGPPGNPASTLLPSIATCMQVAAFTAVAPFLMFAF